MTNALPPRFRESSFRFYERVIAAAVDRYPLILEVDAAKDNLSPITYSCRLRDAMTSLYDNQWKTNHVHPKFRSCYNDLIVSVTKEGKIRIGSREELRVITTSNASIERYVACPQDDELTIDLIKTPLDLPTLARLADMRAFSRSICLRGLNDQLAASMQESYDIFLQKQDDGSFILI